MQGRVKGKDVQAMRGKEKGQALAEAAVSLIILLLLLGAIIDLGRGFFTYLALHNAAAEGAYYASIFPTRNGVINGSDPNTIIYRTQNESPSQLVNWNTPGVNIQIRYFEYDTGNSTNIPRPGDYVDVTISYPFGFIGPVPGLIGFPDSIPMSVTSRQTVLDDPLD